jgi:hypothetical protein
MTEDREVLEREAVIEKEAKELADIIDEEVNEDPILQENVKELIESCEKNLKESSRIEVPNFTNALSKIEEYNLASNREFVLMSLYYSNKIEKGSASQKDAFSYILQSIQSCSSNQFLSLTKHDFYISNISKILNELENKIINIISTTENSDISVSSKRYKLVYKNISSLIEIINIITKKKIYCINLYFFKKSLIKKLNQILSEQNKNKELFKFQESLINKIKSI